MGETVLPADPKQERAAILARALKQRATELDPTSPWFQTSDLAAVAALNAIADAEKEHGGVLFKNADGLYGYSVPVPGSGHDFELRARFNPKLYSLAGIYHTHPPDDDSHLFSPSDIDMAARLKLLSYIKVLSNGEIRRFDPATSDASRDRRSVARRRLVTSEGDLVKK